MSVLGLGACAGARGPSGKGDSGGTVADAGSGSTAEPPPFDISSCPGATITSDEIISRFAPATTTAKLGDVVLDARRRDCGDQTGCLAWTHTDSVQFYTLDWFSPGDWSLTNPVMIATPSSGVATCTLPGPKCRITIGSLVGGVWPVGTAETAFRWLGAPDLDNVAGSQQVGNVIADGGVVLVHNGSEVNPWGDGKTTNTCLFGTQTGRVYTSVSSGQSNGTSGIYTEYQIVVYGSY